MTNRFMVTGSASGIGARVTSLLAARGARVMATDVHEPRLRAQAESEGWPTGTVRLAVLDVTRPEAWQAALEEVEAAWQGLDVLFNIAGYLMPGYAHQIELVDVDRHFDINVKGLVYGTRLAAERMVAQGHGHIVNIASMAALAPVPGLALYSASKYAVRAFSLAAAEALRAHGVAVTVVCPDAVATPMLDKQRDFDEAALTFTAPRVLTADEVARHLVGPVLDKRPLMTTLPPSRAWLARVADLAPSVGRLVAPWMERQGRAAQRRARGR